MKTSSLARACAVAYLSGCIGTSAQSAETLDFNRDIRPILSDRCFQCHGPDEEARQAELRLDVAGGPEGPFANRGDSIPIRPRELGGSELWKRIVSEDPDEVMPPADSHVEPLSEVQKDLIRRWILQGAEYSDFWALVPPQPQAAPPVSNPTWSANHIDPFILARLEEEGLAPRPRADRRTLMRRVSFDLTGLPPTRQEIRDFLADESPESYERVVDRLLASPQYGEHMAKYWLDLVRFADTNGIHHDHFRQLAPYRDWIIRALNENLPFDQFLTDQLAGDLFNEPTIDQQIASGFNRLHLVIDAGTALPEESFHRNVVDRVTAFGTVVLGLTLQCSECHDHKFDPLTQKDFYQLYAFFNNIDAGPETPGQGIHAPYIELPTDQQRAQREALDAEIAAAAETVEQLKKSRPEFDGAASFVEGEGPDPVEALDAAIESSEQRHSQLVKLRESLQREIITTLVMKERAEVRPTHIHIRGAYDQFGEEVQRATPAYLPPMTTTADVKTRLDLARWATDPGHPLTARVAVNRYWQQLFGVGLVKTSEDFGMQGDWPSHRKLLDDLARRFIASGWNVKALMKSIVLSATYQQSSQADPDLFRTDPENRLLARGSRYRLDSEMIRDQILAVSGLLVKEMYGKSVKPPQPPNLWTTVSMVSSSTYKFVADEGEKIRRRSVYSFWKRAMPPPQMTIFDAPTRERCIARRERTNTPLQALVLMNEQQYFLAARKMAIDLLTGSAATDGERIAELYEAITSQLPDDVELATLRKGLDELRAQYDANANLATELTSDLQLDVDQPPSEIAAYTLLINSLLNLDITKTRE